MNKKIIVNENIELQELSTEHIMPIFTTIDSQREYLREWLPFIIHKSLPIASNM